jgi:hypothetical protein
MTPEESIRIRTGFENRLQLPELLNSMGLHGEGVEVGVQLGTFSEQFCLRWSGQKLWCVDHWPDVSVMVQAESALSDACKMTGIDHQLVRKASLDAAPYFNTGQLDFVYIDADHNFDSVKSDILAWWPKVRDGGLLCGHDFMDGCFDRCAFGDYFHYGVKSAVLEFASEVNRFVFQSRDHPPSWLIIK